MQEGFYVGDALTEADIDHWNMDVLSLNIPKKEEKKLPEEKGYHDRRVNRPRFPPGGYAAGGILLVSPQTEIEENAMKICLLNDSFAPVIDGVVNVVMNYANYLTTDHGAEVIIGNTEISDADYNVYPYRIVPYQTSTRLP